MQPFEFPSADGLSRDQVEPVAEVGQHIMDVLVHYALDCEREYLHHHHVTVM
jgi:hypothetical protein